MRTHDMEIKYLNPIIPIDWDCTVYQSILMCKTCHKTWTIRLELPGALIRTHPLGIKRIDDIMNEYLSKKSKSFIETYFGDEISCAGPHA